ncbi:MAG: MATE family efflux transporter [Oscillospiraceae bacterium]|jgi:putative MATE family efflux protein|nr:MATE family efflux transporter [Oscillospiraceae bacterium]
MKTRTGDMTQGGILRQLIVFAFPLLLGNLLQQLYNAVDAIIVGNFVGRNALAAVGSTGSLVQLLISFFMGMSSGASVMISRYYGAGDNERLSRAVHTAILLSIIIGAVTSVAGVILSPLILRLMNTPAEMMDDAVMYLRIFFAGLLGLTVYNMGASALQAVGNSRYPLYFLIISTIVNTVGDLALTVGLNMGVAGAALATIFAELLSAVLVLLVLGKSKREYKLSFRKLKMDKQITKNILSLGLPGAFQSAIVSVSNVVVQSYMNGLGTVAVAGYSAANKLDAFLQLPIQAMALAVTTFVSQNLGAGKVKRARSGTKMSMLIGIAATLALSIPAIVFHERFLMAFSSDSEVLRDGWEFMKVFAPFYFILSGTQILPGALRGAGDVKTSTFASVGCFVVLRQVYLFIITKTRYTIFTVAFGYPMTWALCALIVLVHYLRSDWRKFDNAPLIVR